jgi:hypothetical protein
MRLSLVATLLLISFSAYAEETQANKWTIYSNINLWAYSESQSFTKFADEFNEPLDSGDTALTHNFIELGGRWNNFHLGAVQRFDYITAYTQDTALVHHSNRNNIVLPDNRDYDLSLEVERITAKGYRFGYVWQAAKDLHIDFSAAWYNDISDLQSGRVIAIGDLEPITEAVKAQAELLISDLTVDNRDLSPLVELADSISAILSINYAYDKPQFDEPFYQRPVIVGDPNPLLSGVDFVAPGGDGYAFDIAISWRASPRLQLDLHVMDLFNEFTWEGAPQTRTTFDLNPALIDALQIAQDFVDGLIVTPNDIVDRHVFVEIFNADFTQKLPTRFDLKARYKLPYEPDLFGWKPGLSLLTGWYHTDTQEFPRIGLGFDDNISFEFDIGSSALAVTYDHRYVFARLVTDSLDFSKANAFGLELGLNFTF